VLSWTVIDAVLDGLDVGRGVPAQTGALGKYWCTNPLLFPVGRPLAKASQPGEAEHSLTDQLGHEVLASQSLRDDERPGCGAVIRVVSQVSQVSQVSRVSWRPDCCWRSRAVGGCAVPRRVGRPRSRCSALTWRAGAGPAGRAAARSRPFPGVRERLGTEPLRLVEFLLAVPRDRRRQPIAVVVAHSCRGQAEVVDVGDVRVPLGHGVQRVGERLLALWSRRPT
jgi:hypothetical protein